MYCRSASLIHLSSAGSFLTTKNQIQNHRKDVVPKDGWFRNYFINWRIRAVYQILTTKIEQFLPSQSFQYPSGNHERYYRSHIHTNDTKRYKFGTFVRRCPTWKKLSNAGVRESLLFYDISFCLFLTRLARR